MATPAEVHDTVRRLHVPAGIRAESTLARVDYADTFVVDVGGSGRCTAEAWARTVLEGAPLAMRARLLSGWTALGLKLAIGKPEAVLGWEIRRNAPDAVLLGADGRLGLAGELLFRREGDDLRFATFVRVDNRAARLAWGRVEGVHDPVVRSLLARVHRDRVTRSHTGGMAARAATAHR